MEVFAIIVLYNPDLIMLIDNLSCLRNQVSKLIVIDNSPNRINLNNIPVKIDFSYYNSNNNGIAGAQNIGIDLAIKNNAKFILFMDQDSCPSNEMVSTLLSDFKKLKNNNINIAAIGPIPINSQNNLPYTARLRKSKPLQIDNNLYKVNELISSGMLIDITTFDKIGVLDEKLFIDGVDHEWCWRAILNNFQIFQTRNTNILHSLGEGDKTILGIRIAISSSFRIYYQYRNYIYLFKKSHVPVYWKLNNLIKYSIKYLYFPFFISFKYFSRINKGILDGFKL
jgi:rhamnosyltransferase